MVGGGRSDAVGPVDRDDLGRAADVNMAATWQALARLAGRTIEQVGNVQLFTTGIPAAFFNGAMATGPSDDPERCVARSIEFMAEHGVPFLLWAREGVDGALLEAGRAAALRDAGGPPAMAWSPISPPPPARPDLEINVVDDRAGLDAHRDLMVRAFEMPPGFVERLLIEEMVGDPAFAIVVGRVDGVPVSTAVVSITGTTAGIYNVATPVEHQRRGYGRALTRAAVDEGVRRGCDHAILQASPAGQPVYEEMGFVHVGRYVQLEGPPT